MAEIANRLIIEALLTDICSQKWISEIATRYRIYACLANTTYGWIAEIATSLTIETWLADTAQGWMAKIVAANTLTRMLTILQH
jgi:hypothetical protein